MDYISLLLFLIVIWTLINVLTNNTTVRKASTARLPPGPYPFPIIGSIHKLGPRPHHSLANLSKTYGPLMSLELGRITTIVISSPTLAKEVLQKQDLVFSTRSTTDASRAFDHHNDSVIWLPIGDKWKKLRKICKEHILGTQVLEASQGIRRKAVNQLLDYTRKCSTSGEVVDIGRVAFTTSLNALSNLFFSTDLARYDSTSSQQFRDIVMALMENFGKPNLADFFPVLQLVDPQGLRRQANLGVEKLFAMFDRIIDQRVEARIFSANYAASNDVLDSLLNLGQKNDSELNRNALKHLLGELFMAGTDTNSSTVEWAMAELLHNPEKMVKARSELMEVIGKEGMVEESDISRLTYLQAILKETLRLHPPAPFLVPRKTEVDVEVEGYIVPKNAQVLVNAWAIGRDSGVWSNPESFMPERFLDCETDFRGKHFELIPFGAGRRMCPGLPLAQKLMHLILGSLIHSFNWKLSGEMKAEDMDMSDKFGLTLQRAESLNAIPLNH